MHLALVINSIVCVIGTVLGLIFAGGSIVSIANMNVPWSGILLIIAVLLPLTFVLSGVGAWIVLGWGFSQVAIGLIAFPWLYVISFSILMINSFPSS
jgi:hypothetical protein